MEKVTLGRTGIEVSQLGIGTGTAHPSGIFAQARMSEKDLAEVLLFAFDKGITFWDTAFQYKTYPHIRQALKHIPRSDVILATKVVTCNEHDTRRDLHISLKDLDIEYIDICLLHGVRTKKEFQRRSGAFDALLKLKHEGRVRAIGVSTHGLSALQYVLHNQDIDIVWARINYAGIYMDTGRLPHYDRLVTVPCLKHCIKILPSTIKKGIFPRWAPEKQILTEDERLVVEDTLTKIHTQSKGVVGMKVLVEGHLSNDVHKAMSYVRGLSFVDAFIIGMMNKKEVEMNCNIMSGNKQ
jgi:aryl-alcohol dehydrogenase-like predicted oxidoreductase